MSKNLKTVPHQRTVKVSKSATDKAHKYTTNNLEALAEANKNLQSLGGFKLYMYLAKNQNNYDFALSSTDFKEWSGLDATAYTTAFEELKSKGYLVALNDKETIYFFRDKLDIEPPTKIIQEVPTIPITETSTKEDLTYEDNAPTKPPKLFIF